MPISFVNNNKLVFENDYSDNYLGCLSNAVVGSRNIILCKNLRGYKEFVLAFKQLNKPCTVINICLEVLPEEEGIVQNEANFESFYTCYGDYEKQNNHVVSLAIERIKREIKKRKLDDLKKAITKYKDIDQEKTSEYLKEYTKLLQELGGN